MVRIIDWKILSTMIPWSRQHVLRIETEPKYAHYAFPKRVRLGDGPRSRTGWVLSEVEAWLEARMGDRSEGAAKAAE